MKKTLIGIALSILPCLAFADFSGKVIRIADGDTITVLTDDKKEHRVRLLRIDAPESSQAFGQRSRKNLSDLVYSKYVTVKQDGQTPKDRYNRVLGTVYVGSTNVNLQQVKDGYAWADRYFLPTQSFIQAEKEAKSVKRGLWIEPNPIEPWKYRKK